MLFLTNVNKLKIQAIAAEPPQPGDDHESKWFWIEKDSSAAIRQSLSDAVARIGNDGQEELMKESILSQMSFYCNISYQEVLYFMKMAATFERDRRNQDSMTLWLIMNFPIIWNNLPKSTILGFIQKHGGQRDEDDVSDASMPDESPEYSNKTILEYLFPYNRFMCVLDSMSRQQVLDLHQKLYGQSFSSKSKQSFSGQSDQNQLDWIINSDYSRNEIFQLDSEDFNHKNVFVPQYKDLIKLAIHKKFEETITEMREEIENLTLLDQEDLGADRLLEKDKRAKMCAPLRRKKCGDSVDEKLFTDCSIEKTLVQRENEKQLKLIEELKHKRKNDKSRKAMRPPEIFAKRDTIGRRRLDTDRSFEEVKRTSSVGRNAIISHQSSESILHLDFPRWNFDDSSVSSKQRKESLKLGSFFQKFKIFKRKSDKEKDKEKNLKRSNQSMGASLKQQSAIFSEDSARMNHLTIPKEKNNLWQSQGLKNQRASSSVLDNFQHSGAKKMSTAYRINEEEKESDDNDLNDDLLDNFEELDTIQSIIDQRERDIEQRRELHQQTSIYRKYFHNMIKQYRCLIDSKMESSLKKSESLQNHFKKVKTPIAFSVKFLACVIEFWTLFDNHNMLNKGYVYDNKGKHHKEERIKFLEQKVHKFIIKFAKIVPVFEEKEDEQKLNIPDEMYHEYAKQCFYINIYNALILFKLAEIISIKPTRVFAFKNFNSWLALEQNSRIMLNGDILSAFDIKNKIIKNADPDTSSSFAVNPQHLHPLIDFAFFIPRGSQIHLHELCFINVDYLLNVFPVYVKRMLVTKIKLREDFNLIMLPQVIRQAIPKQVLKPDRKLESNDNSTKIGSQTQVMQILTQIKINILECDHTSFDKESSLPGRFDYAEYRALLKQVDTQILRIRERIKQGLESGNADDLTDYVIEYQAQCQSLKAKKLTGGLVATNSVDQEPITQLKRTFDTVLKKESNKEIRLEEVIRDFDRLAD